MVGKYIVIDLDHDNCDLSSEQFDDVDDALNYIEESEHKCYLIKIEIPYPCADGLKVDVIPYT